MENQLVIEIDNSIKSCAFTGHRILDKDFSLRALKKVILEMVKKGADTFYCGMAIGFDLAAAECVLALKKKYPLIQLVACIPCENQDKSYTETDKKRYAEILKKADEKTTLFSQYQKGCMLERNKYMADRADVLIAYCKKASGGTAYTLKYFQKKYPLKACVFL